MLTRQNKSDRDAEFCKATEYSDFFTNEQIILACQYQTPSLMRAIKHLHSTHQLNNRTKRTLTIIIADYTKTPQTPLAGNAS